MERYLSPSLRFEHVSSVAAGLDGICALRPYTFSDAMQIQVNRLYFSPGLIDSRLSKQQQQHKKMAFKIIRPYNDGYGKQNNSTVLKQAFTLRLLFPFVSCNKLYGLAYRLTAAFFVLRLNSKCFAIDLFFPSSSSSSSINPFPSNRHNSIQKICSTVCTW